MKDAFMSVRSPRASAHGEGEFEPEKSDWIHRTFPGSGMFTLDLFNDEESQTPRISARFAWVRSGELIFVSNPQSVNAWLDQHGLSSDTLKYRLDPISAAGDFGTETLSVSTIYDSQVRASSMTTYSMGSGCGPVGTYCDPK